MRQPDKVTPVDPLPPYGMSIANQGGTVHRVTHAFTVVSPSGWTRTWAKWACGPDGRRVSGFPCSAKYAQLLDDPGDNVCCARCGVEPTGRVVVGDNPPWDSHAEMWLYVARQPDGLIKVGCTNDVARRMYALGDAELLASRPGNYVDERRLFAKIPLRPVEGNERFAPGSEAVILAGFEDSRGQTRDLVRLVGRRFSAAREALAS
jgi:hypothetical protein